MTIKLKVKINISENRIRMINKNKIETKVTIR